MGDSKGYFAAHRDRFISEWRDFLAFKSISADPAYHNECVACAEWVRAHLSGLGFKAELWETATKPVVFAAREGNPTKPIVLFYGHYDVQPVDPIDLWESDPFQGVIRDGRMYARGAQDNKGQVFYFLKGLEALIADGVDLPTIKVIIEGEEESGSQALHAGVPGWADVLKANILMVCDTGTIAMGVPTITMGMRGMAQCEVRVFGPKMDLHSGIYGGVVLNPIQALTSLMASLHRPDGSVAVPGFYDGVPEPSREERSMVNSVPLDLNETQAMLGVPLEGGERRFSPLERRGLRPTVEINGIAGGYQGPGGKTVIPAMALAKLSLRLVPGQDPHKCLSAVVTFLKDSAPQGVTVEVIDQSIGGPALKLPLDSPTLQVARDSLQREFECSPVFLWEGASIPIIPLLSKASGAAPLLIGFGMEEDNIHSPNESFSLRQFEDGFRYVTSFLRAV